MTVENTDRIVEQLRQFRAIADVPQEELLWLAGKLTEVTVPSGEILAKEGGPADAFHFLLEGEFYLRPSETDAQDTRVYISRAGDIVGKLPYSRLTQWPGNFRSIAGGRVLSGSTDVFPEMTREAPTIVQRLVGIMSDRIRSTTKEDQQRDKLAALGKLSAGLAHELNNPAASAKRAALALSEAQEDLRDAIARLDSRELTPEQRKHIASCERQALQRIKAPALLDTLAQSEQEEEITSWLEEHDVADAGKFAPVLAEATLDVAWLENLGRKAGDALPDALSLTAKMSPKPTVVSDARLK